MDTNTLRVRAYNVRFGDAILVSVPDLDAKGKPKCRHILIDVGNVLSGKEGGGKDHVFEAVISNVLEVLGGEALDLYVMTHEHMDHVQGLFYAASTWGLEIPVRYAWLTASAAPGYYERHPEAKKKRAALVAAYLGIRELALALEAVDEPVSEPEQALLLNNDSFSATEDEDPDAPPTNPRKTLDCIKYLRGLATVKTTYVHREIEDLDQTHPFREAQFEIWGPEEDTASYYGKFRPMVLGVAPAMRRNTKPKLNYPVPPPGVDTSAFYNLVEARRNGYIDNLLAIDKAANNTSIVFCLKWRGWRLLFPGDAEIRSWRTMNKHDMLKQVHFLKVSHHGSHNGTPADDILDSMLKPAPYLERQRIALVSSHPGTYNNVPNDDTIDRLEERDLQVRSVHSETADGEFIDLEFSAQE